MNEHCEGNNHVSVSHGIAYCPTTGTLYLDADRIISPADWPGPPWARVPFIRETCRASFASTWPRAKLTGVYALLPGETVPGLVGECRSPEEAGM